MGILANGAGQIGRNVGLCLLAAGALTATAAGWAMLPVPLANGAGAGLVLIGALIVELRFEIVVQRGDEGAGDAGVRCVVAGVLAGGVEIFAFEAHVVTPQREALVAQHLLAEAARRDAEIRLLHVVRAEAGKAADFLGDGIEV